MRETHFWELIEFSGTAGRRGQAASLYRLLLGIPETEIVSFAKIQHRKMYQLYKPDLLAAHFIIRGSVSEDSFEEFTAWIVMQGKRVFDGTRKSSSHLTEVLKKSEVTRVEWDAYTVLAGKAYLDKTKLDDFWTRLAVPAPPELKMDWPKDPHWFQTKYPDLYKAFGGPKRLMSLPPPKRSRSSMQKNTHRPGSRDSRVAKILANMVHFMEFGAANGANDPNLDPDWDSGYTQKHVDRCGTILNGLLDSLKRVPQRKRDEHIRGAVKKAVMALNTLNRECGGGLIETDQREEICTMVMSLAKRAGLKSSQPDITEEWREW